MIAFNGSPDDGGLYTGYDVIRDGQAIGVIEIGGIFRKDTGITLTEEERGVIAKMCRRVYEMPSEYGCLGVGESPTAPFEEFQEFLRRNSIRQDLVEAAR